MAMFTMKPGKDGAAVDAPKPALNALEPSGSPQVLTSRPDPSSRPSGSPSVIGADLTITGDLESKGELQIEGEVEGDIHAVRIVVAERARITGNLVADDIVVRGTVAGSIRAINVALQSSSRFEGDVFHKSLAMEQGAFFEGNSRRSEHPTAVERGPNELPPPGSLDFDRTSPPA